MSGKHIPGPWTVGVYQPPNCGPIKLILSGKDNVASLFEFGADEEREADTANLIAAAPDMMQVLKKIQADAAVGELPETILFRHSGEIDDAIAKATGAQS